MAAEASAAEMEIPAVRFKCGKMSRVGCLNAKSPRLICAASRHSAAPRLNAQE